MFAYLLLISNRIRHFCHTLFCEDFLSCPLDFFHQHTLTSLLFGDLKFFGFALSKVLLCCWKWPKVSKNGHSDWERFCSEKAPTRRLMLPQQPLHVWKAPLFLEHLWLLLKPKNIFQETGVIHTDLFPWEIAILIPSGVLRKNSKGEFWHSSFVIMWSSGGKFDSKI